MSDVFSKRGNGKGENLTGHDGDKEVLFGYARELRGGCERMMG